MNESIDLYPLMGAAMLDVLGAVGNPHRMRIIAALHDGGRQYVSQLARDLGISRPLLHLHLAKLEKAGLIAATFELSPDGKALKFFALTNFTITLTPDRIAAAAASLPPPDAPDA